MRGSTICEAAESAATERQFDKRRSCCRRVGLGSLSLFCVLIASISTAMPAPGDAGPTDPAVSESTGAANLRIPIEVPPGPGGLAPSLSLNYSSRQGDSPYGVGWNLDLGEIACSVRFGVPDYSYVGCKKFELNGQLLTRDGATNSYHSFVETFQKIEYLPASQSWQVINPNGTILRYGVDTDARVYSGTNIARWLLSEIQDPFGNTIFISYDDTTDVGTRYPLRVTYGASATKLSGPRQVDFIFGEDRPDPIHNYAGGIEQKLSKRLTDINVSSYGALVRRYAFGYSLGSVVYTTGRTRLSWVQQFGSDCTGDISLCTGLPRTEYEYTDPNDTGTPDRYSKFDVDENYVVPFGGGNAHYGVAPVRLADINGDGLMDLIEGGYYIGGYSLGEVKINTGSGFGDPTPTPNSAEPPPPPHPESLAWTTALQNLPMVLPRADFKQTKVVSADRILGENVGIFEATFSTTTELVSATPPAHPLRPFPKSSSGAKSRGIMPGMEDVGWIEAQGRMFFQDVDGDGFADIIVSIRLSGVDVVVDSQGNAIPPTRVPGRTVSKVYRNLGHSGPGWVEDSSLAEGLPVFGYVNFQSTYAVDLQDPWEWDFYVNGIPFYGPSILVSSQSDTCGSRGLRGWGTGSSTSSDDDVCIDIVNLDPVFTDFNGDGYPDVMLLELDDPEAPYRGPEVIRGFNPAPQPSQLGRSVAWVQVPDAAAGEARWVRATEYDLPSVNFGAEPWGDNQVNPFAHSGLGRTTGNHDFHEGRTAHCPSGWFDFGSCGPTEYNQDNGVRLLDLNRDGLTDVVWGLVAHFSVDDVRITSGALINTGAGWCSVIENPIAGFPVACPSTVTLPGFPGDASLGDTHLLTLHNRGAPGAWVPPGTQSGHYVDLNADGWLDFVRMELPPGLFPAGESWLYNPAGATWVRDERYDPNVDFGVLIVGNTLDGLGFSYLDINGDGAGDIIGDRINTRYVSGAVADEFPQAFISNGGHSDLIRLVRNGTGGEIEISYESATIQRDLTLGGLEEQAEVHAASVGETIDGTTIDDVVRWTSQPVVSEIRVTGPNRAPGSSTNYRYAQPRYCWNSRSDLGFRIVERTRPGGETVTSSFYQVHGRAGKTAQAVVSGDGGIGHVYQEVWETQEFPTLPGSGRPAVPATQPGSIPHAEVHVGRLAQVLSYNTYDAGSSAGGQRSRTVYYDDSYGYNFVEKVVERRPTGGVLATLRLPGSDAPNSIYGLAIEQKLFDYELATLASEDFKKHTLTSYELGRPSSVTEVVKDRDDVGAGTPELHSMLYDAFGNLTQQIVHGATSAEDRVTDFCYDGDNAVGGDTAWCPDYGQNSHSVRVGVTDALGGTTFFEPDAGTGSVVGTQSIYTDEPSTSVDLDVFGRPIAFYVSGDDVTWIKTSKTVYDDIPFQPSVVAQFAYPDAGSTDAEAIWSSIVSDGFGGTWKEIGQTPTGYVATLTYHDPTLRTLRKSLPVSCGPDSSCAALSGATEPYAMLMETDSIGRPIRDDTPHGFSIFEYSSTTKTSGPGALGGNFDSILEKNGKGDVIQRAMDGDRIAWVDECETTLPAGATTIGACSGSGTTTTHYTYEATGEISTIYDARAGLSSYSDPNHSLRYHYDTLGRVVQIDDPALSGTGHTLSTYNIFGETEKTTNARLEDRVHSYDVLGRLASITTPADETNYTVLYRANEKQSAVNMSDDYVRSFIYDELGRVQTATVRIPDASSRDHYFHTDYAYDLIGRVTEVIHPAKHYDTASRSWQHSKVRYEYDGGFLSQICELGSAISCDTATTKYVSSVEFDSLGRQESIASPAGTRTFAYNSEHRLSQDHFASPAYEYTRNYASYDGIGNILSITGSESAATSLDMNESYVYDQRNRIQQWTKEGTPYAFAYDDLGNLTLHGGETQVYDDPQRPHAVVTRDTTSTSPISYSYDDDGNVESILGGSSAQYFQFDSANQIVCLGSSSTGCGTRVVYDISGRRVVEYPDDGESYKVYFGDAFLYEHTSISDTGSIEVMLDGKRIALKRFDARRRGVSTAGLFVFSIPLPWIIGGMGGGGLLLMLWGFRNGTLVLVQLRPLRAATALTAAGSLLLPSIAMSGGIWTGPSAGSAPSYYWEISDSLGTGMVLLDVNGDRVRHQVFTPFGRIHAEVGADFRTFYAGHRRDEDSGMFYMQTRWYDPGSGRFLSVDPVVTSAPDPQSFNPYAYVRNNPLNLTDPDGTCWRVGGAACGGGIKYGLGWTKKDTPPPPKADFDSAELKEGALEKVEGSQGQSNTSTANQGNSSLGRGADPFAGVEQFPVFGEGPASHSPAQLDSLFSGVEQFLVTPNSFANFMNAMMSGGLAMRASPASSSSIPSAGLAQAYGGSISEAGALLAIAVGGLETARVGLIGLGQSTMIARTALGLTARQAVVAATVGGVSSLLTVAAGLFVAGIAIENGIRLINERTRSDIQTPNGILGREFFPVTR